MKRSDEIIFEDVRRAVDGLDLEAFKNSKILILGASGLIGAYFSYLIYYLNIELGFNIEADVYTKNVVAPDSRLAFLAANHGIRFLTHDVSEYAVYEKKYDFMIHAAGYASPAFFLKDPVKTIDLNYVGMKCIFESAVAHSPKAKILYLSSSEVYGSPTEGNFPTPETYVGNSAITNNRACYIESKRLAEVLCLSYARTKELFVRIARPALAYGPGMTMTDGRVISQFINKAHTEKNITMVDDGRDLRCFCYMSDVLRELLVVLLFSKDTIYNVGSAEEEISILQLAQMVGSEMSVDVVPGPGKDFAVAGAPTKVHLDMSKLQNEFGFTPRIRMKEGLRRTIDWNLALLAESRG